MVKELWQKLVTSLRHIRYRHTTIKLWVMTGHGISYMQKFTLSSEQDLTMLKELLSMSPVMIEGEDLQKLHRAGLAHVLYEMRESPVLSTPQQEELKAMHEAWNDKD